MFKRLVFIPEPAVAGILSPDKGYMVEATLDSCTTHEAIESLLCHCWAIWAGLECDVPFAGTFQTDNLKLVWYPLDE